jgi:pilus assembly protein Flp/PilA
MTPLSELGVPMRRSMSKIVRRFIPAQEGATAIEYALIAGGIASAIVAVITTLGGSVNTMWARVATMF